MHKFFYENFLANVFPQRCLLCQTKSEQKIALCDECIKDLPIISYACLYCGIDLPQVDMTICGECLKNPMKNQIAIIPFHYQPPIDHFITQLKFRQKLITADILAKIYLPYLKKYYLANPPWPEIVFPIPLHRQRLRERGFNQTLEIIKILQKESNFKIDYQNCERLKPTLSQANLNAKKRKQNMKDAFVLKKNINYQHIAIFDDVITTTNTIRSFIKIFKKTSVKRIDIWAIARA